MGKNTKEGVEGLTDKELVEKYGKWLKAKKIGKLLEDEVEARYTENGKLKGIVKVEYQKRKGWKSTKNLPKKFMETKALTASKAFDKMTDAEKDKYIKYTTSYSYVVEA